MASSVQIDEVKKMLECPICIERLTIPKLLPCHHTFCEKCISQHIEIKQDKGTFPCPMCNYKLPVPKTGAKEYPSNIYLSQISDLFPETSSLDCSVCKHFGRNVEAVSLCIECKDHLCKNCSAYHCNTKLTINHQVVGLDEVRSGKHFDEIRRAQLQHCSIHNDKLLEIYCVKCETPICYLCKAFTHDGHKVSNIEDAVAKADKAVKVLSSQCEKARKCCATLNEKRKNVLQDIERQKKESIAQIKKAYKVVRDRVNIDEIMAIQQLEDKIEKTIKQAEASCNDGEQCQATFDSVLGYAKIFLESSQEMEKLQKFNDIKLRLQGLKEVEIDVDVLKPLITIGNEKMPIPKAGIKVMVTLSNETVPDLNFGNLLKVKNSRDEVQRSSGAPESFIAPLPLEQAYLPNTRHFTVLDDLELSLCKPADFVLQDRYGVSTLETNDEGLIDWPFDQPAGPPLSDEGIGVLDGGLRAPRHPCKNYKKFGQIRKKSGQHSTEKKNTGSFSRKEHAPLAAKPRYAMDEDNFLASPEIDSWR